MKDVIVEIENSVEWLSSRLYPTKSRRAGLAYRPEETEWMNHREIDTDSTNKQLRNRERRMEKCNIHLIAIPEGDNRWNIWEAIIEKMMAENYPDFKRKGQNKDIFSSVKTEIFLPTFPYLLYYQKEKCTLGRRK